MKVEDNSSNIEEVNWKYIPNIYQISQYLPRSDLIQLSSTCKHLRLKLKSKFISKLELIRGGQIIPGKPNISSRRKQLDILFNILEEDYLGKHNIVNHCIIWEFFNSRFAKNFFNIFTNITRLELYSGYVYDYYTYLSVTKDIGSNTAFIEALYPLKNLESLTMNSELVNNLRYSSRLALKLPLCLKSLILIESKFNRYRLKFYPIEIINEKYSNLKKAAIINDRMLSNMTASMKSLTDVTIFNHQHFTKTNLAKFFLLNPQLEKLEAPVYFLECDLVNSILQMKQLKQLAIKYSQHGISEEVYSMPVNTSIEYLNISCHISRDILVPILNNLKSIKVLEFSNFSFYSFLDIELLEYEGRIPLLHLNNLWYAKDAICIFNNPKMFDSIKFTNMFELDYYLTNYEGDDLEDWNPCHLDLRNNEGFTLIKGT